MSNFPFKSNLFDPVCDKRDRPKKKKSKQQVDLGLDLQPADLANLRLEPDVPPDPDRLGNSDWCLCGECVPMPSLRESVCCRELGEGVERRRTDPQGVIHDCVSQNPCFSWVVLLRDALETALTAINKDWARGPLPPSEEIPNSTWRVAAYRQFTHWTHGRLGKQNRRVIPSCCVQNIRTRYPETSGHYTGYLEVEEERIWPV